MLKNIKKRLSVSFKKNWNLELLLAAKKDNLETIKQSLKKGANINIQDDQGMTPLHYAAAYGYSTIAEHLVQQGANVNLLNSYGSTALHLAVENDQLAIVNHILKKQQPISIHNKKIENTNNVYIISLNTLRENTSPINIQDNHGRTPLHLAVINGFTDIENILIAKNADINILDEFGSILHWAADLNRIDTVNKLIKKGINVNILGRDGSTPLHWAAAHQGCEKVIKLLIKNGATIDIQNSKGQTALHSATRHHHQEAIKILLEKEADSTIRDYQRRTILDINREIVNQMTQNLSILGQGYDNDAFTPDAPLTLQVIDPKYTGISRGF